MLVTLVSLSWGGPGAEEARNREKANKEGANAGGPWSRPMDHPKRPENHPVAAVGP